MRAETRSRLAEIQVHAEKILCDSSEDVHPIIDAIVDACENFGRPKARNILVEVGKKLRVEGE